MAPGQTPASPGRLILVTGGARSGRSAFAERRAHTLAGDRVVYIATAAVYDQEMAARVADHRTRRPATWQTIETKIDLFDAVRAVLSTSAEAAPAPQDEAGTTAPGQIMYPLSDETGAILREPGTPLAVLVDSIDAWVSNRLLAADPVSGDSLDTTRVAALERTLVEETRALAVLPAPNGATLILVTSEAGQGVVPPYPLGRAFRDLLGRVNAALAANADQVYLMVAGLPVDIKRLAERM